MFNAAGIQHGLSVEMLSHFSNVSSSYIALPDLLQQTSVHIEGSSLVAPLFFFYVHTRISFRVSCV